MDDYRTINMANWDERAPAHAASLDYGLDRFVADPAFISDVLRFDLPLLGDVSGLRGIHLQCHLGTDTISLSRLGARMTGLDFSAAALAEARALVARTGDAVEFVQADVYDAVEVLGASAFDLVFTGIGAICWLPSIERWARTVAGLLRPGGRLFIREGHPMLWGLDEPTLVPRYSYFEHPEPLVWDEGGTYVETDVEFRHTVTHEWNRGLGEIITALLGAGMEVTGLVEHDSVPWEALPGHMTSDDAGEWRLTESPERLAASYTLQARKREDGGAGEE